MSSNWGLFNLLFQLQLPFNQDCNFQSLWLYMLWWLSLLQLGTTTWPGKMNTFWLCRHQLYGLHSFPCTFSIVIVYLPEIKVLVIPIAWLRASDTLSMDMIQYVCGRPKAIPCISAIGLPSAGNEATFLLQ